MADQKAIEDALSVLRADYWDDVRGVVENLEEEIKAGNIEDREAAEEWLRETVDGHSRVIYTREAILCLLFSSNDAEGVSVMGSDIWEGHSDDVPYSTLAYYAFEADVMEEAEDILRRLDEGEYAEDDEEDEEEDSEDE